MCYLSSRNSVFAKPDINMRGVGRIRDSYANPRLLRILPTPLMFTSGLANTEFLLKVLYKVHQSQSY